MLSRDQVGAPFSSAKVSLNGLQGARRLQCADVFAVGRLVVEMATGMVRLATLQ